MITWIKKLTTLVPTMQSMLKTDYCHATNMLNAASAAKMWPEKATIRSAADRKATLLGPCTLHSNLTNGNPHHLQHKQRHQELALAMALSENRLQRC